MGTPQDNDAWNAKFATKFTSTVIALNYAKAPKNAFPGPIHVSLNPNLMQMISEQR